MGDLSAGPFLVELRVEADHELPADPEGWRPQVAARPHGTLQDRLSAIAGRSEPLKLFALGNRHCIGILQQLPDLLFVKPDLFGVDDLFRFKLFSPKKLPGMVAGRSALAQISPIDLHPLLLGLGLSSKNSIRSSNVSPSKFRPTDVKIVSKDLRQLSEDHQGEAMTDQDFKQLCSETKAGTTLSFNTGEQQVHGKFVGCEDQAVIFEVNGRSFIWPRDLLDYRKPDYPIPSYS